MSRRYFYKVIDSSEVRGMNREIHVYTQMSNGEFSILGKEVVNTASYIGDKPTAIEIIYREVKVRLPYNCKRIIKLP